MAIFPRKEGDIYNLAKTLQVGLLDHGELYPEPPKTPAQLAMLITEFENARTLAVNMAAQAENATVAKLTALEEMAAAMKADLRYAEDAVNYENEKLKFLGWSGRKPAIPLTPPGQTQELRVVKQGEGWVQLEWNAPVEGGTVGAYMVMRRERPEGPWQNIQTAMYTQANLTSQPRGKELEFRIIATNKAGEGPYSNTEMVVL